MGKRKSPIVIRYGETYEKIKVIGISGNPEQKPRIYLCQCLACGRNMEFSAQKISKYQNIGCEKCRELEKQKKWEYEILSHIGENYGALEIIGFKGFETVHYKSGSQHRQAIMNCQCQNCKNITSIPLKRLLSGGAKQCRQCSEKNLATGRKIAAKFDVDGTKINMIDGRRKINKNSQTGVKGVSKLKNGKYRAYITFKRKQYNLGLYDTVDDAAEARKIAEKEIFGKFLEEYYEEKYVSLDTRRAVRTDGKNQKPRCRS